jgi:hypothetical protein
MKSPPKKERGRETALKTAELPVEYYLLLGLQADASAREGARLFLEFWRTGNQSHLQAFVRCVTDKRASLVDGGSK